MKDVGFIVEYSSEERFVSSSENVSDCGNAISTVSVAFAASQKGINSIEYDHVLRSDQSKHCLDQRQDQC